MPGRVLLIFYQGAGMNYAVRWDDGAGAIVNTAGWTGVLKVRSEFDTVTPAVNLTTAGGGVQVGIVTSGGISSNVRIVMTAAQTAALVDWGNGLYDLNLTPPAGGGERKRILEGPAVLSRWVSY